MRRTVSVLYPAQHRWKQLSHQGQTDFSVPPEISADWEQPRETKSSTSPKGAGRWRKTPSASSRTMGLLSFSFCFDLLHQVKTQIPLCISGAPSPTVLQKLRDRRPPQMLKPMPALLHQSQQGAPTPARLQQDLTIAVVGGSRFEQNQGKLHWGQLQAEHQGYPQASSNVTEGSCGREAPCPV